MECEVQGRFLTEPECYKLLRASGFAVPPFSLAQTEDEAVLAAERIGYPVVLKVVSPNIVHKSDVGGVIVNLSGEALVRNAFRTIMESISQKCSQAVIEGALIMPFYKGGLEVIVGGIIDEQFGPAVMFGLGGIFVELLKDVTFRVAPFSQEEAGRMIKEVKGYPLLSGYRGREPLDVDELASFLSKISEFLSQKNEILELDLNPVFLFSKGLAIADCRIKVR